MSEPRDPLDEIIADQGAIRSTPPPSTPTPQHVTRHEPGDLGPVVYLDDMRILALVPLIRRVLAKRGVSEQHIPDVVQDVVLGAWVAMLAGRFRLREGDTIDRALRNWISTIALNHAANWQARAFNRLEIPFSNLSTDPDELACGCVDPWSRYDARQALRSIARSIPRDLRVVATLATHGCTATEIAMALGVSRATASSRLRKVQGLARRAGEA